MKATLIILSLSLAFNASAEVSLQDCLVDALSFAGESHRVTPLPECAAILDSEAQKIEATSGNYRAYGKDHIIYVDKMDENGTLVERSLLSGDQTELLNIQKIFIDPTVKRLFVINLRNSKDELFVYDLEALGNVTPLNVMKSDTLFVGVTSVKAEGEDKIEIVNAQGSFLINADAENRTSRSVQKALTITPK